MDTRSIFLRLLEQSCDLAIVLLDSEGRITEWSGGAAYVFGYEAEEVKGAPASILFIPEDRAAGYDRHEIEVARNSDAAEDDRWMRRKDGSKFWAIGVLTAIRDEDGAVVGFAKVLRNRTDLKEQLEGWRLRVVELEDSMRRRDAFLSTLLHELRAPLAPIANALQIIRTTGSPGQTVGHMVKVMERQMQVLQRLVDDLMDMSRIEHGKVALELESLPIREVLAAAVEDTEPMARQKGHRVQLILPAGEIVIEGDRKRLHQVFVNLLVNAIKYTPQGGHIRLSATVEGREAVTRIEDSGIGIGSDMLPRIFELFTQVDSSRDRSEGGMGIGLALVRDLVALHRGSVQVRSEGLGKGSEFVVRLPLGPGARPNDDGLAA